MTAPTPRTEAALEPDLEICDPHHHLWDLPGEGAEDDGMGPYRTYLLPDLVAGFGGHRITSTLYMECGSFHRADGPAHLKSVGETEFANGVAAMAASGRYGGARVAEGIVGQVDLTQGDRVDEALAAHIDAAGPRFRGIRQHGAVDPAGAVPDFGLGIPAGLYALPAFRDGMRRFAAHGLVFDAWLYHPQLGDLADLARAFPGQAFVLDHAGTPIGIGAYADRRDEVMEVWRRGMADVAACPNVSVKLGGFGMFMLGFDVDREAGSEQLAALWKPHVETCIDLFGVDRAMFESNYPVDAGAGSYGVIWNAFKRIAAGYSGSEKAALFRDTARRVYGLPAASAAPERALAMEGQ